MPVPIPAMSLRTIPLVVAGFIAGMALIFRFGSPFAEATALLACSVAFFLIVRLRRYATALSTSNARMLQYMREQDSWNHELNLSREKLRIVINQIPAVIWTTDAQLRITQSDGGGLKALNLEPGQLCGTRLQDYLGSEDPEFPPLKRHLLALGGQSQSYESVWRGRAYATQLEPLRDRSGTIIGVVGATVDITEHKQRETQLTALADDLARSNQDLELFAYAASHDLKEPLRMVACYVKLLERRYRTVFDAEARRSITFALNGTRRMSALIDSLLNYARVGTHPLQVETIDSEAVVGEVLQALRPLIAESAAQVSLEGLPTVRADRLQLGQLLQNLLTNALRYRAPDRPARLLVAGSESPSEWLFRVQDNGIGISPADKEKVFTAFQRLHGRHEIPGEGIGLTICKRIVQRHGGRIWLDSEKGVGTTFFFTIPKLSGWSSVPPRDSGETEVRRTSHG